MHGKFHSGFFSSAIKLLRKQCFSQMLTEQLERQFACEPESCRHCNSIKPKSIRFHGYGFYFLLSRIMDVGFVSSGIVSLWKCLNLQCNCRLLNFYFSFKLIAVSIDLLKGKNHYRFTL